MRFLSAFLSFSVLIPVSLAQTPVVADGGVINAASFAKNQAVTPGSLVTIFGTDLAASTAFADTIPLSASLGGVSVKFNGVAAPMLFVSQGQINAQLPWEVLSSGTSGTVNVVVTRGSASSAPKPVEVGPFSPGIFNVPGPGGSVIGIASNADGSLVAPSGVFPGLSSHPAKIGDTIIILGTGLGAVDPPAVSGNSSLDKLRTSTTKPVVLVGGKAAEVPFSGLSPQFVGVNQINAIIPQGVAPGNAVPLQLQLGGITTAATVTIAVQ